MRTRLLGLAIVAGLCAGCSSSSATAPTATPAPTISAPAPQSPVSGQLVSGLTVTLTAGPATVGTASYVLQYRFQIIDAAGSVALDSGLVSASQWTTAVALTPDTTYTWRVRAESQGFAGAWSDAASFKTPDPPAPYSRPIGDWQSCSSITDKSSLVSCIWQAVHPTDSVSDLEVVKRVAWLLRGEGAGLLIKTSGDGIVLWQGYSFSASRVCYPDGHIFKVLIDAGPGGSNLPEWADNDFVDPSLYVPAIDPIKP